MNTATRFAMHVDGFETQCISYLNFICMLITMWTAGMYLLKHMSY